MLMLDADSSLRELLGSAESVEDFAAMEELIAERETKKPKPVGRWVVKTLGEVAEALGYAKQTVNQWRSEVGMPGEVGAYPIPEIAQWRFAKLRGGGDLAVAKKEQDLELGKVELESRKMDLAKERGELLDRNDVELWAATALIEAREQVMQLPEMLATSSPPELREFVRTESDRHCRDVLISLRRRLESDQIASDETPTATGESAVD